MIEAHLNELVSASGFTSLIMMLIVILSVGGFCAAIAARGPLASKVKGSIKPNQGADFKEGHLLNRKLKQRVYLNVLEGDRFGQTSQFLKTTLQNRFMRFFGPPAKAVVIVPTGAQQFTKAPCIGAETQPSFDVHLAGKVKGQKLELYFTSPAINAERLIRLGRAFDELPVDEIIAEPIVKTIIPLKPNKPTTNTLRNSLYTYHCYDFPLISLKGLTRQLPGIQKDLLQCALIGALRRGLKISKQDLSVKLLNNSAQRFDQAIPGLKQTQPILYQETTLVCAWCHMMVGLLGKNKIALTRALVLYKKSEAFNEDEFSYFDRAAMLANQVECTLALALLSQPHSKEQQAHYLSAIEIAPRAMTSFERCSDWIGWAKMVSSFARGRGALAGTFFEEAGNKDIANEGGFTSIYDQGSIEKKLTTAIAHLQKSAVTNGDEVALCEAYYALSCMIKNTTKQHMGVQEWERAENSFLAALSYGQNHEDWFSPKPEDIHFELGQLYLQWGTAHGDQERLEKAIHHFSIVKAQKPASYFSNHNEIALAIAQSTLNLGGITNKPSFHKSALTQLNTLKDQQKYESCDNLLDRSLAVARARLALAERDRNEARRAITQISAVIGQKTNSFPTRDVLLRLRARLREMLYQLEGDDRTLDRAINDRRDLINFAKEYKNELRWAVEAGDLAGLLSRRQFKGIDNLDDFHEAGNLLQKGILICESYQADYLSGEGQSLPYIKAGLYLKQGRLLERYARVEKNLALLNKAVSAYEQVLILRPREQNDVDRAKTLNRIGQILIDKSEHYGEHEGLERAANCFAQSYDIYLESQHKEQANRMRQFMENAQAARIAYEVPLGQFDKKMVNNK